MEKFDFSRIRKNWIPKDEETNAKWSLSIDNEQDGVVNLSGEVTVHVEGIDIILKGSCTTQNDEESIGKAMQSINSGILKRL